MLGEWRSMQMELTAFPVYPYCSAAPPTSHALLSMPQSFITQAVVKAIQELPGFPQLSVLDLSCGEGELLTRLATQGCRVHGTHFRNDDYIVRDRERLAALPITTGVDLQTRLPFEDA